MWIAVGKRFRHYTLVILLILSLFQIWDSEDCSKLRVEAIRLFPHRNNAGTAMDVIAVVNSDDDQQKNSMSKDQRLPQEEDLFHKYFGESRRLQHSTRSSNGGSISKNEGLDDIKRSVPSCPDPLHN